MHAYMLTCFSRGQLFATLWHATCQAPLSMGFFRQEYWSGLPCPPPGDLLNPGIKLMLLMPLCGLLFPESSPLPSIKETPSTCEVPRPSADPHSSYVSFCFCVSLPLALHLGSPHPIPTPCFFSLVL